MKAVRTFLVWAMVGAGSAAIAYPALTYGQASLRQQRLSQEVRTLLGPELSTASGPTAVSTPDDLGSAPVGAAAARGGAGGQASSAASRQITAFRPVEGQALGLIEVPAVGLEAAFLEGVTDETLMVGPGHLPGTALPGTNDVSVLAAHRDTHFRDLKDVEVGDTVVLRLPAGRFEYRVTRLSIAEPDDTWVTVLRGRPMLRLVTCWPPNYLGPAPQRLVATAVPVSAPVGAVPDDSRPAAHRVTRPQVPSPGDAPSPRRSDGVATVPIPAPSPARSAIALADSPGGLFPAGSLPSTGTAGATLAALAAFGAHRSGRRLAWWFLPWMGGLGLSMLTVLAAWAGPQLVSV
jgi:sortase A